jgi:hypothetical protein
MRKYSKLNDDNEGEAYRIESLGSVDVKDRAFLK